MWRLKNELLNLYRNTKHSRGRCTWYLQCNLRRCWRCYPLCKIIELNINCWLFKYVKLFFLSFLFLSRFFLSLSLSFSFSQRWYDFVAQRSGVIGILRYFDDYDAIKTFKNSISQVNEDIIAVLNSTLLSRFFSLTLCCFADHFQSFVW